MPIVVAAIAPVAMAASDLISRRHEIVLGGRDELTLNRESEWLSLSANSGF